MNPAVMYENTSTIHIKAVPNTGLHITKEYGYEKGPVASTRFISVAPAAIGVRGIPADTTGLISVTIPEVVSATSKLLSE
mmetsp:Transcript_7389/g.8343  ORF Transcript_7389/g.8343 Transcript_7389/m.8343 type:complete len:80 (-) Transcript_7389:80-319(-)|eukprot:CAMPEP_0205812686 /NCGR_PEP_ID=MMETSP0205-20121125/17210_1 /ASSEMBLY_ACC=CAM_ASM_000278 /TAXON_ID=36767 /ORGANISM="Euplotes focardii, Strain TN1" /LENGTH=79 /DNA_ID=CAMNT_0053093753 /DNA_START=1225 /DNA_END=1464 /DNA_ORIENTATION=-